MNFPFQEHRLFIDKKMIIKRKKIRNFNLFIDFYTLLRKFILRLSELLCILLKEYGKGC